MKKPERKLNFGSIERRDESPFGEFRKVVLPILVKFRDGDIECAGSCFVIFCDGERKRAVAITARHVAEYVLRLDGQRSRSDPQFDNLFGRAVPKRTEWKNIEVFTAVYDGTTFHECPIINFLALSDEADDLAIARLMLPSQTSVQFQKVLSFASQPPKGATPVFALGYSIGKLDQHVRDESGLVTNAILTTGLKSVPASVRTLSDDDDRHLVKGPCFGLDTQEVASGMSGGPVVCQAGDGSHWVACGMLSWSSDIRNFAVASVLHPFLRLQLGARLSGIDIEEPTFADLVRLGLLKDSDLGSSPSD